MTPYLRGLLLLPSVAAVTRDAAGRIDEVEYTVVLYHYVPMGSSLEPLDSETKSLRYFGEDEMPRLALPYPPSALFAPKMANACDT
jgi:hypothetical protein